MEPVTVALGARSYPVHIGPRLLDSLGAAASALPLGHTCALISDSTVAPLYAPRALASLRSAGFHPIQITVPAGEHSKSLRQAGAICDQLVNAALDRKAFIIALGGGVIGDLAGFVASIYYRGIPFIQVPTTIVAQVDSAVGGKTGVNTAGAKNLIGAFHQPLLVLADTDTLGTLPDREFNEGLAGVIKHAIIRDPSLLDALSPLDRANLPSIIRRNVQIKAEIVAADEHETTGQRALLNFGHTIGHAIEAAAGYGVLLHGEAISLGLIAACHLSVQKAGLPPADAHRITALLTQFHLPTRLPADIPIPTILAALKSDKKFEQGAIRFILTPRLGEAFLSTQITLPDITQALEYLATS